MNEYIMNRSFDENSSISETSEYYMYTRMKKKNRELEWSLFTVYMNPPFDFKANFRRLE